MKLTEDPERTQFSIAEYQSSKWRWYMRNQWLLDLFVLGGFGMIAKTFIESAKWAPTLPRLRRILFADILGIAIANIFFWSLAIHFGLALRYMIFFIVVERITGFLNQLRSRVEHYHLWGIGSSMVETHAVNSRNIHTSRWVSLFFNHLNYHSVHHAFPRIPFYHLEKAHQELVYIFGERKIQLPQATSYLHTAWTLFQGPKFISSAPLMYAF